MFQSNKKVLFQAFFIFALCLISVGFIQHNKALANKEPENIIILINQFEIDETKSDQFVKSWETIAAYMRKQEGFIDTQLHQAIDSKKYWLNYAKWESRSAFKKATSTDEFKNLVRSFEFKGLPRLYRYY